MYILKNVFQFEINLELAVPLNITHLYLVFHEFFFQYSSKLSQDWGRSLWGSVPLEKSERRNLSSQDYPHRGKLNS